MRHTCKNLTSALRAAEKLGLPIAVVIREFAAYSNPHLNTLLDWCSLNPHAKRKGLRWRGAAALELFERIRNDCHDRDLAKQNKKITDWITQHHKCIKP